MQRHRRRSRSPSAGNNISTAFDPRVATSPRCGHRRPSIARPVSGNCTPSLSGNNGRKPVVNGELSKRGGTGSHSDVTAPVLGEFGADQETFLKTEPVITTETAA